MARVKAEQTKYLPGSAMTWISGDAKSSSKDLLMTSAHCKMSMVTCEKNQN